jgi:hypothetical protein
VIRGERGSSEGILVVTRTAKAKLDLCKSKQITAVGLGGHNGRQADYTPAIKTRCAKKASKKSKKK